MAVDIVILDIREQSGGICDIRFACYFPVANPYPNPSFISAYPGINTDTVIGTTGANYPSQLTAGSLIEEVYNIVLPSPLITSNWTTVEALMLAFLQSRQAYKGGTAVATPTIGLKYKILHDSATGWSA